MTGGGNLSRGVTIALSQLQQWRLQPLSSMVSGRLFSERRWQDLLMEVILVWIVLNVVHTITASNSCHVDSGELVGDKFYPFLVYIRRVLFFLYACL